MPDSESSDAPRRVALVTGGARRVGAAVATDLAGAGFAVAVHYRRSGDDAARLVAGLRATGADADAFAADVGDEVEVDRLFEQVHDRFGRLDALVCTASVWPSRSLEETTAADLLACFRVDALGTFLCARRGGLIMAGQESGGAIVTFGDWALARPQLDRAAYYIAKGSIPAMTRMLAVELARRNPRVRVNAILPGPVMLPEDADAPRRQQMLDATLLRRIDDPDAVARAVRYLIDEPMVTGVCLPVDAGRTIWAPEP